MEAHEDYLRREAKQLKRENTPPRDLSDAYKVRSHEGLTPLKMKPAHEGLVATVKEAGRSIHEIPREELRRTPDISLTRPLKEGSITQVSMGRTVGKIGPTQAAVLADTGDHSQGKRRAEGALGFKHITAETFNFAWVQVALPHHLIFKDLFQPQPFYDPS